MSSNEYNPYWQEENLAPKVENDILDLAFSISCRSLPIDHAWDLSQAIQSVLPWWNTEQGVGLHLIHGGESGNGWQRPESGTDIIYLTKRARLTLRLPRLLIEATRSALQGQTLIVAGTNLLINNATERPLICHPTLYARHVFISPTATDENNFLAEAASELKFMGISVKKMLAGKSNSLMTPQGACITRSLLVTDLIPEDALTLQKYGIGKLRTLGCGLFIPHKNLA